MNANDEPQLPSFASEDAAWAEVARRNRLLEQERPSSLRDYFKPDPYWLVVELPSGDWTVTETTGPVRTRRQRFVSLLRDVLNPFNAPGP